MFINLVHHLKILPAILLVGLLSLGSISLSAQNSVVAVDDFYLTALNTDFTLNPIENDYDPEGDEFFLYSVTNFPSNGTIGLNSDFTIVYSPNLDFCGSDSFIYTISDTNGALDTAQVTIEVNCNASGNDNPPNAGPDFSICALPIVTNTVCISPSDLDGDDVSICTFDVLFECTVDIVNDTCIQFAALPGSFGVNELQIVVCDNGDPILTDTMSYFINLDCEAPNLVEDVIVISDQGALVNGTMLPVDNNTLVFEPLLNDSDNCNYGITLDLLANGPSNGTANILANTIEFTFNNDFTGTDQFQYFACNECGECSFTTVSVNVLPPCLAEYNFCVEEGVSSIVCIQLCELDIEIQNVASPIGTNVSVLDDSCFSYEAGASGTEMLTVDYLNSSGISNSAVLNINIQPNCSPIYAENDTAFISPGVAAVIDVLSNDENVSNNVPVIIGASGNGTASVNLDGDITFIPNAGFTGLETITYELCDDSGVCAEAILYIIVLMNQEPIAVDDSAFTLINTPVQILVLDNDTDPEGDALSVNTISDPINGTAILFNDAIVYTPNVGFTGIDFLNYEVCDVNSNCDQGYVLIEIESVIPNLAPAFLDDTNAYSGVPMDTLVHCYSAVDPEGSVVTYVLNEISINANYLVDSINNCISYIVNSTTNTIDSLEITACDTTDNCSTAMISFETIIGSDLLLAQDDILSTNYSDTIELNVLDNDTYGLDFTIELGTVINSTNLELIENSLVYIPENELNSVDTFSYVLCNSSGLCDSANVILLIGPLVATNDTVVIYSNEPINISVLDNDENQIPFSLESVMEPSSGEVLFDLNTAVITYTPSAMTNDVFTYTIQDNIEGSLKASAEVHIINMYSEIDCEAQPNSFTPNSDGINDTFKISDGFSCFPNSSLLIYNRWGELIFEERIESNEVEWDGINSTTKEASSEGTYYYIIKNSSRVLYRGFLQLIS